MNTNTARARSWRVTLADGQATEVTGGKILVTTTGDLMLLRDAQAARPAHIFARGTWRECVELPTTRRAAQ